MADHEAPAQPEVEAQAPEDGQPGHGTEPAGARAAAQPPPAVDDSDSDDVILRRRPVTGARAAVDSDEDDGSGEEGSDGGEGGEGAGRKRRRRRESLVLDEDDYEVAGLRMPTEQKRKRLHKKGGDAGEEAEAPAAALTLEQHKALLFGDDDGEAEPEPVAVRAAHGDGLEEDFDEEDDEMGCVRALRRVASTLRHKRGAQPWRQALATCMLCRWV